MTKYKIEVDRKNCISAGSCYSLDPLHFEMDKNQKSMVKGGETNDAERQAQAQQELETQQAAQACPVHAISVTKKE